MYFVYIVKSLSHNTRYVGSTNDIDKRINEHNFGKCRYTSGRGPWKLIGYETFSNIEEAKKRERTLKHNPRILKFLKKRALATFQASAALQQNMQVMG